MRAADRRRLELGAWIVAAGLTEWWTFSWPPREPELLGCLFASPLTGTSIVYAYWRWRMRREVLVGLVAVALLVTIPVVAAVVAAYTMPVTPNLARLHFNTTTWIDRAVAFVGFLVAIPALIVGAALNQQLVRYAAEIKDLEDLRERTQNWTDERWREDEVAARRLEYEAARADLLHRWERERGRRFLWQAVLAAVFFGRNAGEVSEMYQREAEELRLRYEILIGRKIERRGVA